LRFVSQVHFSIVENIAVGTIIGKVKAEDRDSGEKGRVSYYLVGGNVFSLFAVDAVSGIIQTVREIDFEESSHHTLSIQVKQRYLLFNFMLLE
jgi:hypothetical protein